MIVNVFDEQSSLKINPNQVERLVQQVLLSEDAVCDEVNIYFVDTQTISQLHKDFFDDPSSTDCITFPMDEQEDETFPYRLLGEVFVCPETALNYSKENAKDPYEETSLYIAHGILHLLGYDDIDDSEEIEMRKAEKRNMDTLKQTNNLLYPST